MKFFLLFLSQVLSTTGTDSASLTTCPLDLSYVLQILDNGKYKFCDSYPNLKPGEHMPPLASRAMDSCCLAVLHVYFFAMADYLKKTSLFRLPDLATSTACLDEYQSKLDQLSMPKDIVSLCFYPSDFIRTKPRERCAGIASIRDWQTKMGNSSEAVDSACRYNHGNIGDCNRCFKATNVDLGRLVAADGNTTRHLQDCYVINRVHYERIIIDSNSYSRSLSCFLVVQPVTKKSSVSREMIVYIAVGVLAFVFILFVFAALCFWQYKRPRMSSLSPNKSGTRNYVCNPTWKATGSLFFKIEEIEKATNNFSDNNFVGRGGTAIAYKGTLSDGTVVAVKKMIEPDIDADSEFCNEVEIISKIKHRNIVPLRGCCMINEEDGTGHIIYHRFLVYDYMVNGNLERRLFPDSASKSMDMKQPPLTWEQRKTILLDVAKGLCYLHYGVKPPIYHRDIKGTNILLDGDMRARVADFGLAKQGKESESHLTTRVAGTHGYVAPEYALYGQLTEKSDVYSFGIVVLEVMCGRKAIGVSDSDSMDYILITEWASSLLRRGEVDDALDSSLLVADGVKLLNVKRVMERFVQVGVVCAHALVACRPTMMDALRMLEGVIEVPPIPHEEQRLDKPFLHND